MRDREQPRAHVLHLDAALQREPGTDECVLDGVLCSALSGDTAAVREQSRPVALDERLECALVAVGSELDEDAVGLALARRASRRWASESGFLAVDCGAHVCHANAPARRAAISVDL